MLTAAVLHLGSIEPQGLRESVSGVRLQEILSNISKKKNSRYRFYLSNYEGFELMGFSTSKNVKNHWLTGIEKKNGISIQNRLM